jgi:hypothetical protein
MCSRFVICIKSNLGTVFKNINGNGFSLFVVQTTHAALATSLILVRFQRTQCMVQDRGKILLSDEHKGHYLTLGKVVLSCPYFRNIPLPGLVLLITLLWCDSMQR